MSQKLCFNIGVISSGAILNVVYKWDTKGYVQWAAYIKQLIVKVYKLKYSQRIIENVLKHYKISSKKYTLSIITKQDNVPVLHLNEIPNIFSCKNLKKVDTYYH